MVSNDSDFYIDVLKFTLNLTNKLLINKVYDKVDIIIFL